MEQQSSASENLSPNNNMHEKCPSDNSIVSTTFLQQLLKANEETPSGETGKTHAAEPDISTSTTSSLLKKIWVVRRKNEEETQPKRKENPGPSSVLKNLHLDHQYMSQLRRDIAPIIQEHKKELLVFPPKQTTTKVYTVKHLNLCSLVQSKVLAKGKNDLRTALPGADEFAHQAMQRAMALLGTPATDKPEKGIDAEGISCIPNAAAIQNNFLDVLNMTSFQPISDGSSNMHELERNLSEVLEIHNNPHSENCIVKPGKSRDTKIPNSCDSDEISENESETTKNLYETELNYALKLMIQRWSEYLKFTEEDIYRLELENAKNLNSTTEVIEMLEDTGRYVWQLIEEL